MATAKAKPAPTTAPAYPENCPGLGYLSFPLWNEADLERLKTWRSEKGHKPGKYEDRIGGSLFIKQDVVDKVQSYLIEQFLPFAEAQYAFTDGEKGFDKATTKSLAALIENEDWTELNLPIRDLSDKDIKSLGEDTDYVAKLQFAGSRGQEIIKKAIARIDGDLVVVALSSVPEAGDTDRLWWGSRNIFRAALNMGAYTREVQVGKDTVVVHGISAYARQLYLRTDLPMNWGGSDDAQVLEDDFES